MLLVVFLPGKSKVKVFALASDSDSDILNCFCNASFRTCQQQLFLGENFCRPPKYTQVMNFLSSNVFCFLNLTSFFCNIQDVTLFFAGVPGSLISNESTCNLQPRCLNARLLSRNWG